MQMMSLSCVESKKSLNCDYPFNAFIHLFFSIIKLCFCSHLLSPVKKAWAGFVYVATVTLLQHRNPGILATDCFYGCSADELLCFNFSLFLLWVAIELIRINV